MASNPYKKTPFPDFRDIEEIREYHEEIAGKRTANILAEKYEVEILGEREFLEMLEE